MRNCYNCKRYSICKVVEAAEVLARALAQANPQNNPGNATVEHAADYCGHWDEYEEDRR